MMSKGVHQMTERILNLTLEIIYLLTGEDYAVVKNQGEHVRNRSGFHLSERFCRTQSPFINQRNYPQERSNDHKVLELANTIIHLLTGEVLTRCRNVAFGFSMGDMDYFEEPKDPYQDLIMDKHQTLSSLEMINEKVDSPNETMSDHGDPREERIHESICADGSSSSSKIDCDRSPHYSSDDILEDSQLAADYQMERDDEIFQLRCKQEEDATEISPGLSISWESHTEQNDLCLSVPECGMSDHDLDQNPSEEGIMSDHLMEETLSNPVNILEKDSSLNDDLNLTDFAKEPVWAASSPLSTDLCEKESPEIQKVHESLAVTLYECAECAKTFKSELDFMYHQGTHGVESVYTCNECQESFSDHADLLTHQTVHTGEKLFVCFECGKSFTQSADLLAHLRIHTREKPFSCSDCGKCFTHKSTLVKHQRIHTGAFACSECGKCFSQNSNLVVHQRSHTGQKPYACSECGKCFSKNSNLVIHQRIHTGEKPFVCSQCGKCFTQCSNLLTHQRIHTGERPYVCSECGKCFTQIPHLIKHQKSHK